MPLAVLVVVEEACAAQSARAAELDHLLDDVFGRVAWARRPGRLVRCARLVADLEEQLHVQLVGKLQRADRVAGLRRGLLDRRRRDALAEHRERLVDERPDHSRGEEAAAVVDDDRRLLDLRRVVERARQCRVGRLLAADDLEQRHLVDGGEEVQADEVLLALHAFGEAGDRQRGCVRTEQCVRVDDRLGLAEHLVLERDVLEDGLDDEVAAGEIGVVIGRRDAREHFVALRLGQLASRRPPCRAASASTPCPSRPPRARRP